ncbi:poly-gamma-glutamate hydrolase family protein [Leptolyngbya sp. DQ-M1]|uniref:poly-gamma-glutamate hydrolase family protein n=1 Tax=Leptolyngbya sp. DQ-M1 TaxID=2933920 RepID=UPI00329A0A8E
MMLYQSQIAQHLIRVGLVALALTLISFSFTPNFAWGDDHFACFDANECSLSLSGSSTCLRNRDYSIDRKLRDAEVVVLSIHGGAIEPRTSEISWSLADKFKWSRYDFKAHGTKKCLENRSNFDTLHITATQFDDPDALTLVNRHAKAIAIHGAKGLPQGTICLGGRNKAQINAFIEFVKRNSDKAPYPIEAINVPGEDSEKCAATLKGTSPRNIVNRNTNHAGLQLELSKTMREDLVKETSDAKALQQVVYGAVATAMSNDE